MCKAEDVRESAVAAKAEDDVRGALYNKKGCTPELGPKHVYGFLAREWELATKKTPRHPPRTKKQIELGFPAPAAFWVGLRPFIFMVPISMVLPPVYLIAHASGAQQVFAVFLCLYMSSCGVRMGLHEQSLAKLRVRTAYSGAPNTYQYMLLAIAFPLWFTSVMCVFSPLVVPRPLLALAMFPPGLWFKNGIGMSVILHRYSAHAAFKVNWVMNLVLGAVGCLAFQGGPLWWGSRHRSHHKFCDTTARDPHSPALMGLVNAFSFFLSGETNEDVRSVLAIDEQFVPKHIDTPGMRMIDTCAFVFPLLEFYTSLCLFGTGGLWVTFTTSWVAMVSTLWFNVRNHPIGQAEGKAKQGIANGEAEGATSDVAQHGDESHTASALDLAALEKAHAAANAAHSSTTTAPLASGSTNGRRSSMTNHSCDAVDSPAHIGGWLLYIFLDKVACLISPAVGEDDHDHHHTYPSLAVRPGCWGDLAGVGFVGALQYSGLAWNVVRMSNTKAAKETPEANQ